MKKILIVDDQSFIRELLKGKLEQIEEISMIEATNGNEALGKAKVTLPDLILMDIVMPNKDGLEALKELKEYDKTQNIPVIIVTSHAEEEKRQKAIQLGAASFIDKADLSHIDLVALVKGYLH